MIMLANELIKGSEIWAKIGPCHTGKLLQNAQASIQRKVDKIISTPELLGYVVVAADLVKQFAKRVSEAQNAETLAKVIAVIEAALNGEIGITEDGCEVLTREQMHHLIQLARDEAHAAANEDFIIERMKDYYLGQQTEGGL